MLQSIFNYPDNNDYWSEKFSDSVMSPDSWFDAARELIYTINHLRAPYIAFFQEARVEPPSESLPVEKRVHGSYLMLSAFAAENLLKGIIARRLSSSDNDGPDALLKQVKTHDLLKLAHTAELSFTDAGKELLMRMTYFAVWAGRYPAPLAVKDLLPRELPGLNPNTLSYFRGTDMRSIDELFNHCAKLLGKPPLVHAELCGYGSELEPWERILMHQSIKPW
ncbi:MAG: hypothetical protein ACOYNB_09995 [Aquabacterium sp.]|jgi:hypothetical protein|uniref:hypothetical protein n=1 Tax=Aquabacterium sp. TaxID=1872578 RepID=UPI003BC8298E